MKSVFDNVAWAFQVSALEYTPVLKLLYWYSFGSDKLRPPLTVNEGKNKSENEASFWVWAMRTSYSACFNVLSFCTAKSNACSKSILILEFV